MAESRAAIELPGRRRPAQEHLRRPLILQPQSLDKAIVAPSPERELSAAIEGPRVQSRKPHATKSIKQTSSGKSLRDSGIRYRRLSNREINREFRHSWAHHCTETRTREVSSSKSGEFLCRRNREKQGRYGNSRTLRLTGMALVGREISIP